jgi:starvation-inducible DNA-binding protein
VAQLLETHASGEAAVTAEALQTTLIELIDLSLQAKQAHWNVVGPAFQAVHLFLDTLTDEYRLWYDEVAERLSAIGVSPDGRIATLGASKIEQLPAGQLRDQDILGFFDKRIGAVASRIRTTLGPVGDHDLVSQGILLTIAQGLDKQRWMLRAHLA